MSLIETSIEAFVPDLKKHPRASCDEITQNFGLLFFLLPIAQSLALPNNTFLDAGGNAVYIGGYDIEGIIEKPDAAATSVTAKLYEIRITDRKIVIRRLAYLTQKFINSLVAPDDISELSDDVWHDECYSTSVIRAFRTKVWTT